MSGLFSAIKNLISPNKKPISTSDPSSGAYYVGSVCRVLSENNLCHFVGKVESYDVEYDELKVGVYRSDLISSSAQYDSPVKILIQHGDKVTILYGAVRKQSRDFWVIHLDNIAQCEDQREGFRQALTGTGIILQTNGNNETIKIPCKLVDISLTGICISCRANFQVNDQIILSDVLLYPDATYVYTFPCVVCRSFTKHDVSEKPRPSDPIYYGCSFMQLSADEQDCLYKDLFFLQRQERQATL